MVTISFSVVCGLVLDKGSKTKILSTQKDIDSYEKKNDGLTFVQGC